MRFLLSGLIFSSLALTGCALQAPYQSPQAEKLNINLPKSLPSAPTEDGKLAGLQEWWKQFDQPLLAQLIDLAQEYSPSLGQAQARIMQARASTGSARAELLPLVSANARATRSKSLGSISTTGSAGLDASWELDLFAAKRSSSQAAQARLDARIAQWHALRVSVAAEVASSYLNYRSCELNIDLQQQDVQSRQQTEALTALKVKAGFSAPAENALLQAALADARQRLIAQQSECDLEIKAMSALTGLSDADLRQKLQGARGLPKAASLEVTRVPAQALQQRPDVAAAERELAASYAEINIAHAARYPSLSLSGSIGVEAQRLDGSTSSMRAWSFGPSLNLPLFNAGKLKAEEEAARARHQEAEQAYRQQVISAVREIEEALLKLDALARRSRDATLAVSHYQRFFDASNAQYKAGGGSLLDLEEARRNLLASRQNELTLQRERLFAWVAVYKALGGGWHSAAPATQSAG